VRVAPYFRHFFIIVVISHLSLAAIYFAAGTLTRNAKVVYGLAACYYPVYITLLLLVLMKLPRIFRILFDPMGAGKAGPVITVNPWNQSADVLNKYVVSYSLEQYANRASMIILSSLLFLIVYSRFRIDPMEQKSEPFTKLTLSEAPERIAYSAPSYGSFELPIEAAPAREQEEALRDETAPVSPRLTLCALCLCGDRPPEMQAASVSLTGAYEAFECDFPDSCALRMQHPAAKAAVRRNAPTCEYAINSGR